MSNTIRYLDVNVLLGSAPDWLVTKYVAQCSYSTANGVIYCGTGTFGYEGGLVKGTISDEGGSFPSSIVVDIIVDFQPPTNLIALHKTFLPSVTATGVNIVYEPYQWMHNTTLLLDLNPRPKNDDYLALEWRHRDMNKNVIASGQKFISGDELREEDVTIYEIVFVPHANSPKESSDKN